MSTEIIKYCMSYQPEEAWACPGVEETRKISAFTANHPNIDNFIGNIESRYILDGQVDIVICDGFTGNIALKTAEGTANFISKNLKESLSKLSMLLSYNSLKKFRNKLDPRKYNGAIFLGLQSPVVKSHGATDSIGFAHSINVCNKIVKANLIEKIESNLMTVDA